MPETSPDLLTRVRDPRADRAWGEFRLERTFAPIPWQAFYLLVMEERQAAGVPVDGGAGGALPVGGSP